jgi:hypothetical protein
MAPFNTGTMVMVILVPLLAWRMYSRFRRLVGRQRLSRIRPWITLTIFPLLILMIAWVTRFDGEREGYLAAGLAVGALLAVIAHRLTRFEATREGLFYTPNAPLGIALSLLMVGRIAYRMVEVWSMDPSIARNNTEFVRSPLTLVIFGVLAGYYIAYAIGLVRWRWRVLRAKREREGQQQQLPDQQQAE